MKAASYHRTLHLASPKLGVCHQQHLRQNAAPCIWTALNRSRTILCRDVTKQSQVSDSSSEDVHGQKSPAVPAVPGAAARRTRGSQGSSTGATDRSDDSSSSSSSSSSNSGRDGVLSGKAELGKDEQSSTGAEPPVRRTRRIRISQPPAGTAGNAGSSDMDQFPGPDLKLGSEPSGSAATIIPSSSSSSSSSSSGSSIIDSGSLGSSSNSSVRKIRSTSGNGRDSSRTPSLPPAVSSSSHAGQSGWQQSKHNKAASGHDASHKRRNGPNALAQSMARTQAIKEAAAAEDLLLVVQKLAGDMGAVNISAAFTHAAKLCRNGVPPQQQPAAVQQLLQLLHQLAEQQLQQCGARQLANIVWSCGRLQYPATFQLLLPEFLQANKLQQAVPQAVSNTLWAAATLGLQLAEGVVQQLMQRFMQVLPDANAQDVANTLWASAILKVQLPEGVVQQLVRHFLQVLQQANTQNVANTLWAVSSMGQQVPAHQLQQLLTQLQAQLRFCNSQDVANTLLACGRMQYAPLQLLSALEQQPVQLERVLAAFLPQHLANMAWACGQLGYRSKLLPGVLLRQAVQLLQDSKPGSFKVQEVCNLCWCAAVLDLQQCVPQVLQLATACKHMWAAAAGEDCYQLYQVHLWLLDSKLPAPDQGLTGVLSQQQLQQCRNTWEQSLNETASSKASELQRAVFTAVQALPDNTWQHPPVPEQRTRDGSINIDIAATTVSGVRLAIEAEGPSHYVQPRGTYDGSTLFRNRALAVRGYVLVSIPYWEWMRLRGAEQQQQYLKAKLSKLQAAAPGSSSTSHRNSSSSISSSSSSNISTGSSSNMRVRRRR